MQTGYQPFHRVVQELLLPPNMGHDLGNDLAKRAWAIALLKVLFYSKMPAHEAKEVAEALKNLPFSFEAHGLGHDLAAFADMVIHDLQNRKDEPAVK